MRRALLVLAVVGQAAVACSNEAGPTEPVDPWACVRENGYGCDTLAPPVTDSLLPWPDTGGLTVRAYVPILQAWPGQSRPAETEGGNMARTTQQVPWQVKANERLERFTTFAAELLEPFPDHSYDRRQTHAMLARYVLALGVDGTMNGNTFEEFGELVETAHVHGRITTETYDATCRWLAEVV